ncbi:hypothetical protein CTAYLR_001903 [Chrysophaeum taylorii]|uniref:biotin synthase n=1 Tax=Chrysophaeum taylorii TaxID=2483200 RepID=A0AAD7U8Y8_9STRA|nr:hypothetical protein CTAYLR_001903 [Chrysophaeum taylorii]
MMLSSSRWIRRGLSTAAAEERTITVTRVIPHHETPETPPPREGLARAAGLHAHVLEAYPVRSDWTVPEIRAIYNMPLLELVREATLVHRAYWESRDVQRCTLLSIKTGGCTENCGYCSQSTRYKTHVKPTPQMTVDQVLEAARRAKEAGSTRFCMGAAWRQLGNKRRAFSDILEMVEKVSAEGLEVCATLGMLDPTQATQLKQAGLTAYNHNLDTSRDYYPSVVTTRTYDDRLDTIANVRAAGISVCSGGILGLGEAEHDRVSMLHTFATLPGGHPESLPVNALVAVSGTPMEDTPPVSVFEMTRMIATARVVLPKTMVRLSAGRLEFSKGEQALMFLAGANSIFNGDKLLTTPNPNVDDDAALFDTLGLTGIKPRPRAD